MRERSTTTVAILGAGTREAIWGPRRGGRRPTPGRYRQITKKHRWRSPSDPPRSEALLALAAGLAKARLARTTFPLRE